MKTMTAATVRIECKCKTCKTNAEKVGASFPLKADIPVALAAEVGKTTHYLVSDAHNPDFMGQTVRARLGIRPVA